MASHAEKSDDVRHTPLHPLHQRYGARMDRFAGYLMPVQFEGVIAEHKWTRSKAGLFDVSHMGQRALFGSEQNYVVRALEGITPGTFDSLHQVSCATLCS